MKMGTATHLMNACERELHLQLQIGLISRTGKERDCVECLEAYS